MNKFLEDYKQGKESGRYIQESLPNLSFKNKKFELALCFHYQCFLNMFRIILVGPAVIGLLG